MANNDLTRARRKLAKLRLRQKVLHGYINLSVHHFDWEKYPTTTEARRMSRKLDREIKAQELEVRRLALAGPWYVRESIMTPGKWYAECADKAVHIEPSKARAVAFAERMNRKEHGK